MSILYKDRVFTCSARDFRCYPPVNRLRFEGDRFKGDSLVSSISRDTLSTNETHEKDNFDWYIIMPHIYWSGNQSKCLITIIY